MTTKSNEAKRLKGTVTWFSNSGRCRGTGYIKASNGRSYFVHWTDIVMDGYRTLETGDVVTFIPEPVPDKHDKAAKVKVELSVKQVKWKLKRKGYRMRQGKDRYGNQGYLITNIDGYVEAGIEYELNLEDVAAWVKEADNYHTVNKWQQEIMEDPRCVIANAILDDFDVKIPFISWMLSEEEELIECYDDLAAEKQMPLYKEKYAESVKR